MDTNVAYLEQQQFMETFGSAEWDVYQKNERKQLYDKVGLAIFGLPDTGYEKEQWNHIRKVVDIIVKEDGHDSHEETWMSIIIVMVELPESVYYYRHPVFQVPKNKMCNQNTFIDCIGRVYENWTDFMENNKLPQSNICYPVDGEYRKDYFGQVLVKFGCIKSDELLVAADAVSNTVARGSIGVALAALAFLVAAPLVMAAMVGGTLSGVYGAARAAQDQVDRKKHGQDIGLEDETSFRNWVSITMGLYGVRSGFKGFKERSNLSGSAKVGVAFRAANSVRESKTPQIMFQNLKRNEMLLHDLPAYALLFGHAVVGAEYAADFLCANEQRVLDLKSKIFETKPCGKTVRYLEYVGVENQIPPGISESAICRNNCTVRVLGKIKDNIQECINSTLTGKCFGNISHDMKVVIDFFSKYDLSWAIDITRLVACEINCPNLESFCGIMSRFHHFNQIVIKKAHSKREISIPRFTPEYIFHIVKICINKQYNFCKKFGKLCEPYIMPVVEYAFLQVQQASANPPCGKQIMKPPLSHSENFSPIIQQNTINPPHIEEFINPLKDSKQCPTHIGQKNDNPLDAVKNIKPTFSDSEIFYAASKAVGCLLTDSNAKIVRTKAEIFVIITDTKINVSAIHVSWQNGKVNALCRNIDEISYVDSTKV